MPIDYNKWRFFFEVFLFVWNLGLGAYLVIARRQQVTADRIDELEAGMGKDMGDINDRLTRVERDLEHVPSHDDLGKIYERLNGVDKGLSEMKGEFVAVRRGLDMIHQFLLDKK
jgi:hypothetical protein